MMNALALVSLPVIACSITIHRKYIWKANKLLFNNLNLPFKTSTMCLAIPGKILSITNQLDETFRFGKVSFGGINKEVNLCMVPEANIGDYVLVHVGVAMSVVDEEEAQKVFSYLKDMGEVEELETNDRMIE
jgi:hydrogenase expression/formation protein HypC